MKINYAHIKEVFSSSSAWAYAECYDAVRIGKWNGSKFEFPDSPAYETLIHTLRVFDADREIRFVGDKMRDTAMYNGDNLIDNAELTYQEYYMYGEHQQLDDDFTRLWEQRGRELLFPAKLEFPNSKVALKLGVRSYIQYNPVPVCPKDKEYDFGLNVTGSGPLEVIDYAYTGFCYADGKAVEL